MVFKFLLLNIILSLIVVQSAKEVPNERLYLFKERVRTIEKLELNSNKNENLEPVLPIAPSDESSNFENIAIVGTSDIHGHLLPTDYITIDSNEKYEAGGFLVFSSYLEILRKEWGNRLFWLDGGDQYQGTLESNELAGEAVVKSINFQNMSDSFASAIGNHEFDFGIKNFTRMIKMANFTYLHANIKNRLSGARELFNRTKPNEIYNVGSLKIGVFGLTTVQTPYATGMDVSGFTFDDYLEIAIQQSSILRKAGADIVLLTAHVGMLCSNTDDLYLNKFRFKNTSQGSICNSDDEIVKFLQAVPEGVIDAVIGGHIHNIAHHWVNGIPVIQSGS